MLDANNANVYIYAGIVAVVILFLIVCRICMFISKFTTELLYINCEIQRTSGGERRYWLRKRKRLWLSLIPFVKY